MTGWDWPLNAKPPQQFAARRAAVTFIRIVIAIPRILLVIAAATFIYVLMAHSETRMPLPNSGQWIVIKSGIIGCGSAEHIGRLNELKASQDREAATKFVREHCALLKVGTEAQVEEFTGGLFGYPAICVRPRGQTECFWVDIETLMKDLSSGN